MEKKYKTKYREVNQSQNYKDSYHADEWAKNRIHHLEQKVSDLITEKKSLQQLVDQWKQVEQIEDLQKHIFTLISVERRRQDVKFGTQDHPDGGWALILLEEVGEYAKSLNEQDEQNLDEELVQVAAVAVAWLEARLRRKKT